jgi:hypothetical protein
MIKHKLDLVYDNFIDLLKDVESLKIFIEKSSDEKQNLSARIGRYFKTSRSKFKAGVKSVMDNETLKLTEIENTLQEICESLLIKKEGLKKEGLKKFKNDKDDLRKYIQQFNGYAELYNSAFIDLGTVYNNIDKICKTSRNKTCINDMKRLRITPLNTVKFGGKTKKNRRKIR